MSLSLAGWRRVPIEHGVMLQPADATQALIRITHRQPLRTLGALVAQYTTTPFGGALPALVGTPRPLSTDEGEYAAMFHLAIAAPERRRTIGAVFGDRDMAIVDGRCASPERFAVFAQIVEYLTQSLSLGLGSDRYRRFFYRPPAGWSGLERERCDVWLAPDFPINRGMISVFHARPEVETSARLQHHKLFEELTAEYGARRGEPQPIHTRTGMVGQVATYSTADDQHAGNVVFADGRHKYLLRLETDDLHRAQNTDAFLALVESVEPVPWPRSVLAGLDHWSE